ncbi:hypothetical protein H0A36_06235 [Endozoicomonas sp. SM1973]|uniref:Uncharacterized protein n=1 Tax=Spartinivicinus marinus TaxID=2994442 RepID=A0A853I646_9GAMM|nr:hypothetical protein [Spartinivicinus marinus]MCX4028269.1 hypothetical protein [Spartinivicinus marinus]NYZ65604.1 hypothetical protein [Spartinivicinus marinus]
MDVINRILCWFGYWLFAMPLLVITSYTAANPIDFNELDWNRIIEQDNMVFVPIKDIQRGPIWYTKYKKVVSKPTKVFEFNKVVISLYPKAHEENKYYSFVRDNDIKDAKVNLIPPGQQGCQIDPEVVAHYSDLPESYQPKLLPGNYPYLCEVMVFYLPENQSSTFRLLASNPVLKVNMNIPISFESLPPLPTQEIIEKLSFESVLSYSRPNKGFCTKDKHLLFYNSAKLAQTQSSLFISTDPYLGWKTLIDLFVEKNDQSFCISSDTMLGTNYLKRTIQIQH